MNDEILTKEEIEESKLTQDDLDMIDEEMNEAVEETLSEINQELESNEKLKQETEEIFATDDIQQRIKIFEKYHPTDKRFE